MNRTVLVAATLLTIIHVVVLELSCCVMAYVAPPLLLSSSRINHHHHNNNNNDQYHREMCRLNVKKILKDSKEKMLNYLDEMEEKAMKELTTIENNNIVSSDALSSSSSSLFYDVTTNDNMKRLDMVVATAVTDASSTSTSISRSLCSTLVTDGHVVVNGNIETRKSFKVTPGMRLEIRLNFSSIANGGGGILNGGNQQNGVVVVAQDIPLSILYEDEYMIVLNKAAGMVVHPAVGNRDGTIVNALAYYLTHQTLHGSGDFFIVSENATIVEQSDVLVPPNLMMDDDDDVDDDVDDAISNLNNGDENDQQSAVSLVDYELQKSLVSLRPGIVHRLDKGTTGVLVVAKTRAALAALAMQFGGSSASASAAANGDSSHHSDKVPNIPRAEKTYLAITVGNPGQRVVIDRPIGRHPIHRQRMRVVPDPTQNNNNPSQRRSSIKNGSTPSKGRRALSFVDTIAFDGKLGFVKVRIETGRTHQIRVHLQDRHTPIYGDDIYGLSDWNKRLNKSYGISRPMLHAFRLKIQHPITGESMTFKAPLPDDMRKIIKTIYPQGEEESPDIFATEL